LGNLWCSHRLIILALATFNNLEVRSCPLLSRLYIRKDHVRDSTLLI